MRLKNITLLILVLSLAVPLAAYSQIERTGVSIARFSQIATADFVDTQRALIKQKAAQLARYPHAKNEIVVRYKGTQAFKVVKLPRGLTVEEALEEYLRRDDVLEVEPNYIARAFFVPNDTYYYLQWHLDNSSGSGVNAEQAWDISDGSGVVVAVVDTGIAYKTYKKGIRRYKLAPDLAGTTFVNGYDFVEDDTLPSDDNGHGTHVAGTIAQTTNNSKGTAGLAFGAALMPVKVLDRNGSGTYADVADGIRWAVDNGANVINLSLGGSAPSANLKDAVQYAKAGGAVIVAAAGNDGDSSVSYPAYYPETIAVGATRFDKQLAYYSNYGTGLDLVAPGGDLNVDQNNDGYGDGVLQQTFASSMFKYDNFGYYFYQGTSMAAPHVTAAAALLFSAGLSDPDAIQATLQSTAQDLGASGYDATYGWGLIDAFAALESLSGPVDLPPSVSLDLPADQSVVEGSVLISSTATDDNQVVSVEFYVDTNLIATDTTAPYELNWDSTSVADGQHTLSVTAVDNLNQTASDSINVVVDNINDPPVADAGSDVSAVVGESINFDGSGSYDPEGGLLSYSWDFGDGGSAVGATPSHAYASAGTYTVTLTVTDNGGLSDSDTSLVTISEASAADVQLLDVNARNTFNGLWYRFSADVLNNESQALEVTAKILVTDPSGNPVNWPGLVDKAKLIAAGDEATFKWRDRTPSNALEADGYTATVSIYVAGSKIAEMSDTFRVR